MVEPLPTICYLVPRAETTRKKPAGGGRPTPGPSRESTRYQRNKHTLDWLRNSIARLEDLLQMLKSKDPSYFGKFFADFNGNTAEQKNAAMSGILSRYGLASFPIRELSAVYNHLTRTSDGCVYHCAYCHVQLTTYDDKSTRNPWRHFEEKAEKDEKHREVWSELKRETEDEGTPADARGADASHAYGSSTNQDAEAVEPTQDKRREQNKRAASTHHAKNKIMLDGLPVVASRQKTEIRETIARMAAEEICKFFTRLDLIRTLREYMTRDTLVSLKNFLLQGIVAKLPPESVMKSGQAFTGTPSALKLVRDFCGIQSSSASRCSTQASSDDYITPFLCVLAVKSSLFVSVVSPRTFDTIDPSSLHCFPESVRQLPMPNVVLMPIHFRGQNHNDSRWALAMYDADTGAVYYFDPAAEHDANLSDFYERSIRNVLELLVPGSDRSTFLETTEIRAPSLSIDIIRNFVLSTVAYVVEPDALRSMLIGTEQLSVTEREQPVNTYVVHAEGVNNVSEEVSDGSGEPLKKYAVLLSSRVHSHEHPATTTRTPTLGCNPSGSPSSRLITQLTPRMQIIRDPLRSADCFPLDLRQVFNICQQNGHGYVNAYDIGRLIDPSSMGNVCCEDCQFMADMRHYAEEYRKYMATDFPLRFRVQPATSGTRLDCELESTTRAEDADVHYFHAVVSAHFELSYANLERHSVCQLCQQSADRYVTVYDIGRLIDLNSMVNVRCEDCQFMADMRQYAEEYRKYMAAAFRLRFRMQPATTGIQVDCVLESITRTEDADVHYFHAVVSAHFEVMY